MHAYLAGLGLARSCKPSCLLTTGDCFIFNCIFSCVSKAFVHQHVQIHGCTELSAFLPSQVSPLSQGKFPLGLIFWMIMFCMHWRS